MARRPKLEPITPEEIMDSPALQGFDRFLKFRSSDEPPTTGVNSEIPTGLSPSGVTPIDIRPVAIPPQAQAPMAAAAPAPITNTPVSEPPVGVLPVGQIAVPVFKPRPKIRRAVRVQDGHSTGEQILYQSLWNAAVVESPDTRLICVGYGGMQELCGLDKTNCKDNILSLIEKLAVEIVAGYSIRKNQGNTYRIFSYTAILKRRKTAGLEWVVRSRGVKFVDSPMEQSPIGEFESPTGIEPTAPLGESPTRPIGASPLPLKEIGIPSVPSSGTLAATFEKYAGLVDDDAIRQLLRLCAVRAPEASVEDIDTALRLKGEQLIRLRGIANPSGWLLEAVPKYLEGDGLRRMREGNFTPEPVVEAVADLRAPELPEGGEEAEIDLAIHMALNRMLGTRPDPMLIGRVLETSSGDRQALLTALRRLVARSSNGLPWTVPSLLSALEIEFAAPAPTLTAGN